jgi:hypothetical protein
MKIETKISKTGMPKERFNPNIKRILTSSLLMPGAACDFEYVQEMRENGVDGFFRRLTPHAWSRLRL